MTALFEAITFWHWIILALILLGGEALGAAGFMLGVSISALIVSLLMALGMVHDWQFQFLLFALFSMISSAIVLKFFRKEKEEYQAADLLNDRAAQLIGLKANLDQSIETGLGRMQIGDTLWKVKTQEPLSAGTMIEVYASDGMTLLIRKAS